MPTNKNALTRYCLIDKILSNHRRAFSIQDITNRLAKELPEYSQDPVSKRCVEKDIYYLQYESPFNVDIEEYWVPAADRNGRPYRKRCVRYADPKFSIFRAKLTEEEKDLLSSALDTIGGFDGLENFEWMSDLRERLQLKNANPIISLSKDILTNSSLIARLYYAIRNKNVIQLQYRKFQDEKTREVEVSPHLLKEYNNRWFLIVTPVEGDNILTFALDRIIDFKEIYTSPYIDPPEDLTERYEDIIGITYNDTPLQKVIFWVSDISKDYVLTKPLHPSQTQIRNDREIRLRSEYSYLNGGLFFSINCKENYELIRELTSFGPELLVLSPEHIITQIQKRLSKMLNLYNLQIGDSDEKSRDEGAW